MSISHIPHANSNPKTRPNTNPKPNPIYTNPPMTITTSHGVLSL